MKFSVLSRPKAKAFSFKPDIDDCAIVSITDVANMPNKFYPNPHIKGVCHLHFDDVEAGELNCITEKDAKQIVNFVNRIKDKVNLIVVHCDAGVSRSAGVCAAIMNMLGRDDVKIFENPRFCPNMTCYRAVLSAAGIEMDEKTIQEKADLNLEAWKKDMECVWKDRDTGPEIF